VLAAGVLWGGHVLGAALPRAMAPALAFATLGLLAAHGGRSPVHGYLLIVAVWIGVLVSVTLLPRSDPWLTLNPFGWTYGFGPELVARSKVLYVVAGLVLLLPQWLLLRPERLSRQG